MISDDPRAYATSLLCEILKLRDKIKDAKSEGFNNFAEALEDELTAMEDALASAEWRIRKLEEREQ